MPPNLSASIPRMPSSVEARVRQPFNQMAAIFESFVRGEQITRDGEEWVVGGGTDGGGIGTAVFFPRYLPGAVAFVTANNQFLAPQSIVSAAPDSVALSVQTAASQSADGFRVFTSAGAGIAFTSAGNTLTTAMTEMIFEETGDSLGTVRMKLRSRSGCTGVRYEQGNAALELIEFQMVTPTLARTFRLENRSTDTVGGSTPECQFGVVADPSFVVGDSFPSVARNTAAQTPELRFSNRAVNVAGRGVASITTPWADSADATRSGRLLMHVYRTTTAQEFLRATAASGGVVLTLGNDANWDGLVVNENGEDADVRMEGDTATQLFVVDAGLDAVQVGTTTAGVIADFRSAAIVFNENGADRDFRVEGDNEQNLIFTDAANDRVGIGTDSPGSTLDVNGTANATTVTAGTLQAGAITSDTGLDHGTYTPTRSAESNLDSNVTPSAAQYMRLGNTVTVSGRFTADPTAPGAASFELSLPLSSDFGAASDLAGVAFCGTIAGQGAAISASVANDTAVFSWIAADVTSQTWSYTYTYRVL